MLDERLAHLNNLFLIALIQIVVLTTHGSCTVYLIPRYSMNEVPKLQQKDWQMDSTIG